jgi:hypothetical protein
MVRSMSIKIRKNLKIKPPNTIIRKMKSLLLRPIFIENIPTTIFRVEIRNPYRIELKVKVSIILPT